MKRFTRFAKKTLDKVLKLWLDLPVDNLNSLNSGGYTYSDPKNIEKLKEKDLKPEDKDFHGI